VTSGLKVHRLPALRQLPIPGGGAAIAAELSLPAAADEWLARRGAKLDPQLKRFARRLRRGELEGVELRDGRLHIAPVKASPGPKTANAARYPSGVAHVGASPIARSPREETTRSTRFSHVSNFCAIL
jgi:hypothetical protein